MTILLKNKTYINKGEALINYQRIDNSKKKICEFYFMAKCFNRN